MNRKAGPPGAPWRILTVSGRIDALTGAETERACHDALQQDARVALDLRGVNYLSSAGLRVLLVTLKLAASLDGAFALIAPTEGVREILDMSGFSRIIRIVDDASNLD